MSPTVNGVIQRKLALLDKQVGRLQLHLRDVDQDAFARDWVLRSMAERALQVCAEIMIDIAERIIALGGAGPVATAADAIAKLVEMDVLASPKPYAQIVRFRNMIVHQYEEIDPALLYELATQRLVDFRRFRDEIDQADL